jgi:hypothetical protein
LGDITMQKIDVSKRSKFYDNNPSVKKWLLDWFDINGDGLRCMAMRPDKIYKYAYRNVRSQYAYALTPLTEELFDNAVTFARTIEFFPWIFDIGVTKCMRKIDVNNHRIGITPVIDIDAPDLDKNKKSLGRYDLLDESGKYLEIMNNVVGVFKDELDKVDLWDGSKMTFTGNGINILLPQYYDSFDKLLEYIDGINGLIQDVSEIAEYSFVHSKRPGWNANYKPPGTFHFDNNRLTLEIPDKNKKLDLDWLIEYSNPYNNKIYSQ